ncbi:MAG: thioredoxin [Verrucomicrobiota bacterium]
MNTIQSSILHPTAGTFAPDVLGSSKPVLVDFYAGWCGPCNMLDPVLREIAEEKPEITVAKVNVDQQPELAAEYGVRALPTLLFVKDGEVTDRITGVAAKSAIVGKLDELSN